MWLQGLERWCRGWEPSLNLDSVSSTHKVAHNPPLVNSIPGDLMPSSGLCVYCTHIAQIDAGKTSNRNLYFLSSDNKTRKPKRRDVSGWVLEKLFRKWVLNELTLTWAQECWAQREPKDSLYFHRETATRCLLRVAMDILAQSLMIGLFWTEARNMYCTANNPSISLILSLSLCVCVCVCMCKW